MTSHKLLYQFPTPLVKAIFLNRSQRFLGEMVLPDGEKVISYCANPGSLTGCLQNGSATILCDSNDPKRKLRYTWLAIKLCGVWVGTNTHLANNIVEIALSRHLIAGLENYDNLTREVKVDGTRVDFLLSYAEHSCIVEVKSSTIVENGIARFPDSITTRGLRQVNELSDKAARGQRVVLLFVVQRDDVTAFTVTDKFYPDFARAFRVAVRSGVEIVALAFPVYAKGVGFPRNLPILFD